MSLLSDFRVLSRLALSSGGGRNHAERLENFYRGQAADYDGFRERLLPGRKELCQRIDFPDGGVWLDLGGGTGANLEAVADVIPRLAKVILVDLTPSLLEVAARRVERFGWTNVELIADDATRFHYRQPVDVVTCSYSLTMIPDWFAAVDLAWESLRPGGTFGAVDFYVSRKHPEAGYARHSWWTRTVWPLWFARDNVFLNPDHIRYLHRRFDCQRFLEHTTRLPYLPLSRVPWYLYIGRKPIHVDVERTSWVNRRTSLLEPAAA